MIILFFYVSYYHENRVARPFHNKFTNGSNRAERGTCRFSSEFSRLFSCGMWHIIRITRNYVTERQMRWMFRKSSIYRFCMFNIASTSFYMIKWWSWLWKCGNATSRTWWAKKMSVASQQNTIIFREKVGGRLYAPNVRWVEAQADELYCYC